MPGAAQIEPYRIYEEPNPEASTHRTGSVANKNPPNRAGKAARGRRAGAWGLDGTLGEAWGQPSPAPFRRILLRRRPGCGEIVAVGKSGAGRAGATWKELGNGSYPVGDRPRALGDPTPAASAFRARATQLFAQMLSDPAVIGPTAPPVQNDNEHTARHHDSNRGQQQGVHQISAAGTWHPPPKKAPGAPPRN